MTEIKNKKQCKILICGDELVELKRHAYQLPECRSVEPKIQRYKGNKPFVFSLDELSWIVAVLEAVLNDPHGYPVIELNPWNMEYVPKTDERYCTCKRLYQRLEAEYNKKLDENS